MRPPKLCTCIIALLLFSFSSKSQTVVCPPNIDFELGTTSYWAYYIGSCCPISTPTATPPIPGRHTLTSGAGVDYYGGFPIVSPGGGSYSLRLGNDSGGKQAERARYYIEVPAGVSNYSLIYRYAVVIENPNPPHTLAQQPRFEVNVYDSASGTAVPCATYSYVATDSIPGFINSPVPSTYMMNGLDVIYKDWTTASINLSGLGGTTVAVDFASGDCALGGHFGYGYLDMSCGLFQVSGIACDDTATHVTLSAPAGFATYTWYDSLTFTTLYGTTQTISIPIPGTATTYAVILEPYAGFGCPDTLYTRLAPSHLALNPSHDTLICSGAPITITGGASDIALPLTYDWSPATGLSCATCASPIASPTVPTVYTVTVTNAVGCVKSAAISVSIDNVAGTVSTVNASCYGASDGAATVSATAGTPPITYLWSTVPALTTTSLSGIAAGTYSVTLTDTRGCTDVSVATIGQPGPTVLTFAGFTNDTTCLGANGTITLGGLVPGNTFTISYLFDSVPQTQTLAGSPTGTVVLTGLPKGTYSNITVPGTPCPYNVVGPVVLADPSPPYNPYVFSDNPCAGSTLNLSAYDPTPGVSFSWSGPSGFSSVLEYPAIAPASSANSGMYIVTVMIHDCYATDSAVVIIKPLPLPVAASNTPVCTGDTLYLSGSSSNGATSYLWSGPVAFYDTIQNTSKSMVQLDAAGTYTLTATLNGCMSSTTTGVTINPTPLPPLVSDTEYCQYGVPAQLSATGTNVLWYTAAVGGSALPAAPTPSTQAPGVTTWYVSQVSDEGCTSRSRAPLSVTVDYLASPDISIIDSSICLGNDILFTANNTGDDMKAVTWSFGDGDTMKNVNPVMHSYGGAGTFTVSVAAFYKVCPEENATKPVSIFGLPSVYIGPDQSICPGSDPITLMDSRNADNPAAHWLWSTGETGSKILVSAPGFYSITVTINGCVSTDTVTVLNDCYMDIPNVFTPNNDGLNDYFFPRQTLTKGLVTFKMDVYNRWGELIFSTDNIDGRGWDGKLNNIPQPEGVYVYIIDAAFKDGQRERHQGNVTLLR